MMRSLDMVIRKIVALVTATGVLILCFSPANAGGLSPERLGLWLGVSFNSPDDQFLGLTPDRDLHEASFRIAWSIYGNRRIGLGYFVDLIPVALVSNNPTYRTSRITLDGETTRWVVGHETRYGIGAAPIGLRIDVLPAARVRPFVAGSVGFLAFNGEVPSFGASHLNVTFDFGGGVAIPLNARINLLAGYRLHHLSNANTSPENPGLDSNMFYAGTTWRR